jgi:hypothetical protein
MALAAQTHRCGAAPAQRGHRAQGLRSGVLASGLPVAGRWRDLRGEHLDSKRNASGNISAMETHRDIGAPTGPDEGQCSCVRWSPTSNGFPTTWRMSEVPVYSRKNSTWGRLTVEGGADAVAAMIWHDSVRTGDHRHLGAVN